MEQERKERPNRKRIRLPLFSYSSGGVYFITISVKDAVLCEIADCGDARPPEVRLTYDGLIVEKHISAIDRLKDVYVANYAIMPDHIHLLIGLVNPEGESEKANDPRKERIPRIVAGFKRLSQQEIGRPIYQRRYYDHVIRNERDYEETSRYIDDNPANWLERQKWRESQRKKNCLP